MARHPRFDFEKRIVDSHLDPMCRHVLHILAMHMDHEGRAYPSQERIADHTGMHRNTVRVHIEHLVASGWLVLPERPRRAQSRKPLLYELRVPEAWDLWAPVHELHPDMTYPTSTGAVHD